MSGADPDRDVLIVGGGPVGLGLAIELGQRGHTVTVIERRETPSRIPRGQNLTPRTMEHMRAWGCEDALRAARTIPREMGGGLTAYGTLFSGIAYDWLPREKLRPFYATGNERLPQYATEAVLRERAAVLPQVELLTGWTGEDISQDDDGVRVTARAKDGETRELTGRYLVGCDGARSRVREAAGITETRSDHDRLMVLLVFRAPELSQRMARDYPGKSFVNVLHPDLKGYWQFFGRVAQDDTFFFHAPVPAGTTAENYDFEALLHRAAGEAFPIEFQHVGLWDLRVAIADRYRAGRIFIAGDAAHSHPPYGGYGINTGFEDARNLGWKLAAALEGWAGEGLLDSYEAERRPVFISTARDFIEASIEADAAFLADHDPQDDPAGFRASWAERATGATDEVDRFEPNYEGSPLIGGDGAPSAVGSHRKKARAGHHLTPIASNGSDSFARLGDGYTLFAPRDAADSFEDAASSLGVPLHVTEADAALVSEYGADLVLVRPDGFVGWVGAVADGTDAHRILSGARGSAPVTS
ncbi:FAD-dependent oxidoreductase [Paracoccus sp. TK19116]|uniref:FAD-dependent oxidoreductase n=1 Tax=Paracoccus albicereus TaxID=2922394 RepID=A0ABT1MS27_9RHOB|nr:FAD-dependent monooxygenase [Paracoccus albicereus]MCQ0971107.1 FAD-dependent oxidoreductase [Paracoccus albicereus]